MGQPVHVLVVEDSLLVAMSLENTLAEAGYQVTVAETNAAARAAAAQTAFAAALVDYHLPDGDSIRLCEELRAAGARVALVTGIDRVGAEPSALFDRIYYKPVEEPVLLAWLAALPDLGQDP